ncbi:STAS domain-containing protein [Actinophytocola sp.]|uniref:STAS domain-containing protein n=1 Tax=Actinophytocola sp. TaxID=1872138 RepID=UPI00389B3959
MTAFPELRYSWDTSAGHIGRVTLAGDLIHVNADELLEAVTDELAAHPGLRELHVDCAQLEVCDSRGLSTLLMLRRRTDSLGLRLHIVNRPHALNRMLDRTGTTEYLTSDEPQSILRDQETSG